MAQITQWYCGHCTLGPLSIRLDLHCPSCLRRLDDYATHGKGAQGIDLANPTWKTTTANQGIPTKRLNAHLLSRIKSSSKDAQLEAYLFNEANPWNQQSIVQAARVPPVPGTSSFRLETWEPARAPLRQPYSPERRKEVASTRRRRACSRCRQAKQSVSNH